jgi:hypothetical protein
MARRSSEKSRLTELAEMEKREKNDDRVAVAGRICEFNHGYEASPVVELADMVYVPRLVTIDCPRCGAEVRLDRFLKDLLQRPN